QCHPLSLPILDEGLAGPVATAAMVFRSEPATHGLGPSALVSSLERRYLAFLSANPGALFVDRSENSLLREPRAAKPAGTQERWIAEQMEAARLLLFEGAGGCRYCHVPVAAFRLEK